MKITASIKKRKGTFKIGNGENNYELEWKGITFEEVKELLMLTTEIKKDSIS